MVVMTERGLSAKEIAAARLQARAARLRMIRRRVFATVLATFAIAFGVIGATGSMGSTSNAVTLSSPGSSTTTTSAGSDDSSGSGDSFPWSGSDDSSSGASGASGQSGSIAGAPMTTRQS